ncbi:transcription elongation factor GreAB [Rhizobium sp. LjRoot30]|uniref:transcription elongation factor GreAB n=1 Tax=Rhizobium sp. LjRoot30 TaxID=3342320 RepID=UPI003ECCB6EC
MQRETFFQLTTKDVDILTALLDRSPEDHAYLRLLRNKLNFSTICFRDDVPSDVVTLNSRLCYSINGRPHGPHILVQSEGDDLPAFAISIHTMRGLALLGLAVGEVTTIAYANGRHETLAVEELMHQPEVALRLGKHRSLDPAAELGQSGVVWFRPKNQRAFVPDNDSDGDDPGPQAA